MILKIISITEARKLLREPALDIKELPCFEVVADEEHVLFLVIGSQEEMQNRIRGLASLIDAGRDK